MATSIFERLMVGRAVNAKLTAIYDEIERLKAEHGTRPVVWYEWLFFRREYRPKDFLDKVMFLEAQIEDSTDFDWQIRLWNLESETTDKYKVLIRNLKSILYLCDVATDGQVTLTHAEAKMVFTPLD